MSKPVADRMLLVETITIRTRRKPVTKHKIRAPLNLQYTVDLLAVRLMIKKIFITR